jgi:sugar lactone lactonase YvrE
VIGSDGTIYYVVNGTSEPESPSSLVALNPTDEGLKWSLSFDGGIGLFIGTNGTLYLGSYFTGVNPQSGLIEWNNTGEQFETSAALSNDGKTLYSLDFDFQNTAFVAISTVTGAVEWTFKTPLWASHECGDYDVNPVIGSNGTIYFQSTYCGIDLLAMSPNGKLLWEVTGGPMTKTLPQGCGISSLHVGPQGTIYATTQEGVTFTMGVWTTCPAELFALSPVNGSLEWSLNGTRYMAVDRSGTVFASPGLALNPDGTVLWNVTSNLVKCGEFATDPVIGADGTIYTAGVNNTICAISPNGTLKWARALPASADNSTVEQLVIGECGTLYVVTRANPPSQNGWIYAYD